MAMEAITIVLPIKVSELSPKPFQMDALPTTQVRNPTTNSNPGTLESLVLTTNHGILQVSLNIISLTAPS